METIRERLDDLRAKPRNRRCREVISILSALGLTPRKKPGSHRVYSFSGVGQLTLPCHDEGAILRQYAVKRAIQFIEEVLEQLEQQQSQEGQQR